MSFWKSDIGKLSGAPEDSFSASFQGLIPNNTMACAKIDDMCNKEYDGEGYIQINWKLVEGEYKDRVIFQKIRVFSNDAKKRHRALNMLLLIYHLFEVTPVDDSAPTDAFLKFFIGKFCGIKVQETEPNPDGKQYNYVSEVHSAVGFESKSGEKLVVAERILCSSTVESAFSRNSALVHDDLNDTIPF